MRLAVVLSLLTVAAPLRADVSAPSGGIHWRSDAKAAEREAGRLKRPLLVFFSAEWCMPCKEMLSKSFADPAVARLVTRRFVPLLVDMTADDDAAHEVAERYRVRSLPTLVMQQGSDERFHLETFQTAEMLRTILQFR